MIMTWRDVRDFFIFRIASSLYFSTIVYSSPFIIFPDSQLDSQGGEANKLRAETIF